MFLDPKGIHCIVTREFATGKSDSASGAENFYFHLNDNKLRLLTKAQGIKIRSVAWNEKSTEEQTRNILIGGDKGQIFLWNIKIDLNKQGADFKAERINED